MTGVVIVIASPSVSEQPEPILTRMWSMFELGSLIVCVKDAEVGALLVPVRTFVRDRHELLQSADVSARVRPILSNVEFALSVRSLIWMQAGAPVTSTMIDKPT